MATGIEEEEIPMATSPAEDREPSLSPGGPIPAAAQAIIDAAGPRSNGSCLPRKGDGNIILCAPMQTFAYGD